MNYDRDDNIARSEDTEAEPKDKGTVIDQIVETLAESNKLRAQQLKINSALQYQIEQLSARIEALEDRLKDAILSFPCECRCGCDRTSPERGVCDSCCSDNHGRNA